MRGRTLGPLAAALLAAAPLAAQDDGPPPSPCVVAEADEAMTRWACAGTGANAAVRFSADLPSHWEVAGQEGGHLVLTASEGDIVIQLVGADPLPEPRTAEDSLGFWMRAAGMAAGRELESTDEVDDFRARSEDRVDEARAEVTRAQLDDEALREMADVLSIRHDGREPSRRDLEVREIAGEPAGYLSETWMEDGTEWTSLSYVTVRDGALFIASLATPERTYVNVIHTFDSVVASFIPGTERRPGASTIEAHP